MKITILTFSLLFTVFTTLLAIDPAYEKAMMAQIKKLNAAQNVHELTAVANAFDRIGEMNREDWLPPYYTALAYVQMSFFSNGTTAEKDAYLNKAEAYVKKAADLSPSNSEIVAMEGFVTMGKLTADPQNRGQHLSSQVIQTFQKAIHLEKNNPRAQILMAQMEFGMAQFYGQKPDKACNTTYSSLALFEAESNKTSANKLNPRWGMEMAERLAKGCQANK